MTSLVTSLPFPATSSPPCIRPALHEELQAMCCARLVACAQKEEKTEPAPLMALEYRYRHHYATIYKRAWQRENSVFLLASVQPEHVSYVVPDQSGHAVAGFCSMHVQQQKGQTVLFMDNLFSLKSDYPVGRALVSHTIRIAQHLNASSIMLDAPYSQAGAWYRETAGFGELTAEDQILNHLNKNQRLALYNTAFSTMRERLRDPAYKNPRANNPSDTIRKALDFGGIFP